MPNPSDPHPTPKSYSDNAEGTDRITFACDLSGRYNPYPMIEPIVRVRKFC